MRAAPPKEALRDHGSFSDGQLPGILLKSTAAPTPMLKFSARLAFPGLTIPLLQKVNELEGFPFAGARPTCEREWVEHLVTAVLPDLSDAEVQEIVSRRSIRAPARLSSCLTAENQHLAEEVLDHDEQQSVQKETKRAAQSRSRAAAPSGERRRGPLASAPPPPVEPSPVVAAPPAAAPRSRLGPRPVEGQVFTARQASAFLPQARGCSISVHTARAWQVKYLRRVSAGFKSHTVSWGGGVSHRDAMCRCLRWAWDRHIEAEGCECPWDV